jgi:hypothetical protein
MLKQLQLFDDEPEPGSSEAKTTTTEFDQRVQRLLETMKRIAFKILVWGPSLRSKSSVAEKRRDICRKLKEAQHDCWFSEEFTDPPPGVTLKSYELAQASEANMIVMLVEAAAPGAIGEMHDFCSHRELLPKILLFYPENMRHSYGGQGLVKDLEKGYRNVEYYTEIDISSCRVLTIALEWVQARRSYVFSHTPVSSGA